MYRVGYKFQHIHMLFFMISSAISFFCSSRAMMWEELNARRVIGPHSFSGSVNHTSYLNMLQQLFIPKVSERGTKEV